MLSCGSTRASRQNIQYVPKQKIDALKIHENAHSAHRYVSLLLGKVDRGRGIWKHVMLVSTKNINQFLIKLEIKHEISKGKNTGKWPFSAKKTLKYFGNT